MDPLNQTHAATKSDKINAIYSRHLLMRVTPELYFDRYAQSQTIENNKNTKKGFARRYKNILPATVPLAEYDGTNIKSPNKVVSEEVEFELKHYGDYVVVTDENELYNLDAVKSIYLDLQADQVAKTIDEITKDAVFNGTNVVYADTATTRDQAASKTPTTRDLDLIQIKLKNQGAKKFTKIIGGTNKINTSPINSAYIGIAHHSVVNDLRGLDGWTDAKNYPSIGNIMKGEVGAYDQIRFLEDTEGRIELNTAGNANVYQTIIMGRDAYAAITPRGSKNLEVITKSKQEIGGPLNQFSTLGWKVRHGAAILNEAFLCRLESGATVEDTSTKHYYDYSA